MPAGCCSGLWFVAAVSVVGGGWVGAAGGRSVPIEITTYREQFRHSDCSSSSDAHPLFTVLLHYSTDVIMTNDVITNIEEHKRKKLALNCPLLSPKVITPDTPDPRPYDTAVVLVGTATAALRIEQVRLRKARLVRAP